MKPRDKKSWAGIILFVLGTMLFCGCAAEPDVISGSEFLRVIDIYPSVGQVDVDADTQVVVVFSDDVIFGSEEEPTVNNGKLTLLKGENVGTAELISSTVSNSSLDNATAVLKPNGSTLSPAEYWVVLDSELTGTTKEGKPVKLETTVHSWFMVK
jgi:hypothetical protein